MTPEQREQIQQAKAAGARRTTIAQTFEQRGAWQGAVAAETQGQDENAARFLKIKTAADQSGFFGDVRRAILHARRPVGELAAAIGVEPRLLSDFRAGEADLPAAALDRLVGVLGLQLMQVIPR